MEEVKSIIDKYFREFKKIIGYSYGIGFFRYMGMIEFVQVCFFLWNRSVIYIMFYVIGVVLLFCFFYFFIKGYYC